MKKLFTLLIAGLVSVSLFSEEITFEKNKGKHGIQLIEQSTDHVTINFSIERMDISSILINGEEMDQIALPGIFLPGDEGAPNLPGTGRYVAIPQGSTAELEILDFETQVFTGVRVAPSPRIPWDTETGPLQYQKNEEIYGRNALYPAEPFRLSEQTLLRGVDVVMFGVTPFQYNPATEELIVYTDLSVRISFSGGNGIFGEERLRSRWWDPILSDALINYQLLPPVDYSWMYDPGSKATGCEYLIISPNGADFVAWADSIKMFRNKQGILTDVVTLNDIGSNNSNQIETFINDAYNNWDIPPAAILFLGDYGTNASNSVISPIWSGYCASDNIYADVDNNNLPDIVHARITAQNANHLETMVGKFLGYERVPPTNQHYYDHPITAMGWQTERWFQICSETVNGFWEYGLGKEPVRENKIYQGTPGAIWSTAPNTYQVVTYFGPNYMNYIPATPEHLTDWNGDAQSINDAINAGAFMIQHRDHGYEQGWGEPDYSTGNLSGLDNDDLIFVFSINCLTGKYNIGGECFTEAFHRHSKGALGLTAASEVSYSFVNDAYVWGLYDNLWPEFMPDYGSNPESRDILPAFGNAAGKYFLQQSSWPYNTNNKLVTYHLFHHHGDAFSTVYTEMPQDLTVLHNSEILANTTAFPVLADTGALIGITVNGELIGAGTATGEYADIAIAPQTAGTEVMITVTKQNYYRYETMVDVIDSNIPYVIQKSCVLNDNAGNGNGLLDYGESVLLTLTVENIGEVQANNVDVTVSTANPEITMTDDFENFGNIMPGATATEQDAYSFDVSYTIADGEHVVFDVEATDGSDTWNSQLLIKAHAPTLEYISFEISDPNGNNNGRLDPGETVDMIITVANSGSAGAMDVEGELTCNSPYITISQASQNYGDMDPGDELSESFPLTVDASAPQGTTLTFTVNITGAGGVTGTGSFNSFIGKFPALVLDLDPKSYSGPEMHSVFEDMDIYADYSTSFPQDPGIYKSIFVCLGLHFTNYELSEDEGQQLKDFLLEGGNLYMEGRVTWHDDPQTPVHPMFNINTESQGYFAFENILGINGSFTTGMEFEYNGENPVGNYSLEPVFPAYNIFETQDPYYGCAVAYKADDYNTIGTTFEFGRLVDAVSPSTKMELMQLYLDFFDGLITGAEDHTLSAQPAGHVTSFPNPFSDVVNFTLSLEEESEVTIEIFDAGGNLVETIMSNSVLPEGSHNIEWKCEASGGERIASGIYYCRFTTFDFTKTFKLIRMD